MCKNFPDTRGRWRSSRRAPSRQFRNGRFAVRLLGFDLKRFISQSFGFRGGIEMNAKNFLKSGHLPTLIAAFLYFDVSFMVWVLLGPLAPFLSEDLKLTAAQKGMVVAVPLLGGALFRPIMGVVGDLLGGRRAGMLGLGLTLLPLL